MRSIPEIQEMLDEFQASFDSIRVKTLLSGEYDGENAIIKLNAGAGGTEACDWCGMLYRMYSTLGGDAKALHWKCWITWTVMRPV